MNLTFAFTVAIFLALCFGYPVMLFARYFKLIDIPGSAPHKIHKFPMLLAGGLLTMLVLWVSALIFHEWLTRDVLVMFMGSTIVFLFGLWDDRVGLSAPKKLFGQLIDVLILVSQGVQIHFMDTVYQAGYIGLFESHLLNILLTFFWVIGITNAVNMIDSMDGIVAGMGMIIFMCYLYLTSAAGQEVLSIWSAVMLGICAGLYFWNKILGKIFLGDSGSQTLGFLVATMGVLYNPHGFYPESSWILPIMLLGVPIFDTTLVVISRIKRGQPVERGRRDHTYHRLIALGIPSQTAVLITHIVALLLSGLAFLILFLPPVSALMVFFATLAIGVLVLNWIERKPTLDEE
jgi:UDP-GlcNAc:undecaprenyl-phosphate/decaprenyl-phosphate GlcNAc-1-phosphate transferase